MTGKFQKFSVDVIYEIPTSSAEFTPLVQRINDIIGPEYLAQFQQINSLPPPETKLSQIKNPQNTANSSDNIIGMLASTNKSTGETSLFILSGSFRSGFNVQIPFDEVFNPTWVYSVSSDHKLMNFFDFVTSPSMIVELFSSRKDESTAPRPDFAAMSSIPLISQKFDYNAATKHVKITTSAQTVQSFIYNTNTKRITVQWHFDFPPENWKQTIRMRSIFDLDDASLLISFNGTNYPSFLANGLRPTAASLDFGIVRITVDHLLPLKTKNLQPTEATNYSDAYTAVMPPPNSPKIEDYEFSPLNLPLPTNQNATISNSVAPAAPIQITIPANVGIIKMPFVRANNFIYQSVPTDITNGGKAIYNFTITTSNLYAVRALVNTPNNAPSALYVNIDVPPTDPTNIWDIAKTTGFAYEIVDWRGNGTNSQLNIYPQQNFSLNAGPHKLIIVRKGLGSR